MTSDQPGWPMGVPPVAAPPSAPDHRRSSAGTDTHRADAGVGWAIASLTSVAVGVLGCVTALATAVLMPTHEDGGHGGDGVISLFLLFGAMAWISAWSIVAFGLSMVAMNRTARSTVPRPKVVMLSLVAALAPFAIGAVAVAAAAVLDSLAVITAG